MLPRANRARLRAALARGKMSLALRRDRLRNRRMMILLLLLVAGIFVIPAIVSEGTLYRLFGDATIALVLISGVMAIADHRKLAIALACLALLVIAVRWAEWFVPAGELQAVRHASTLCCLLASCLRGRHQRLCARSIHQLTGYSAPSCSIF